MHTTYTAGRKFQLVAQLLGLLLVLGAGTPPAQAQTMANWTVQAQATVRRDPAQIKLTWVADATATEYDIYRKAPTAADWGPIIATITAGAATASEYADDHVVVGTAYEYQIYKGGTMGRGNGYVLAGLELPAQESRGTLVLLVAATHAAYLAPDLSQLTQDLVGDGWQVLRHDVPATATPPQVRALLQADYQADPTQVKAVFIVGHVAVPYSGLQAPDGHPDHVGAWPADGYYGDLDGVWTDTGVDYAAASRPENHNVPGDGKFDQGFLPSAMELQVGRVDLANLPAFAPLTERDLLRRYLRKDHQFRQKVYTVAERGLVNDNFGVFGGEAFANNGWRNFSALVGSSQVTAGPYFDTLGSQDYLWSYGCGGGWYSGAGGVGSSGDFANRVVKSVFTMQFGSYFGDWDSSDNFLRAALGAEGYTLTTCWGGRPDWQYHQMGLGETIGYAARITQNNNMAVYMALLGDPSLRQHVLAPPTGLTSSAGGAGAGVALHWTASAEPGLGYYVYRAPTPGGPFTRLSAQALPATATAFTDAAPLAGGTATYMVRALQLRQTPTGSYYNLSQGAFSQLSGGGPLAVAPPAAGQLGLSVSPNPAPGRGAVAVRHALAGGVMVVVDALGREVARTTATAAGTAELVLPAPLAPGLYLVRSGSQATRLLVE